MPLLELKKALSEKVAAHLNLEGVTAATIEADFSIPPNAELGHVALPCFRHAKAMGRAANEIAKELSEAKLMEGVTGQAAGPYANFKFDVQKLYFDTLSACFSQQDTYGSDSSGANKRVVLEYCSPNIAKRLAFQHIRSTLIGNTLSNVYDYLGYKTERINFVGDWGSQFARLLAAVEMWGDAESLSVKNLDESMKQLFELYVRFHKEVDKDDSYLKKASECLQQLEQQNKSTTELWKKIKDISVAAMDRTLSRMNVVFHHVEGESTYISEMPTTLEDVKKRAGAIPSEGAWIVEVDGIKTPALIQKRDGTTLYLTRDIAAAIDRFQRFQPDQMHYVVSEQQKLHFQLLFGVLKKMGYDWADRCHHISFGTVLFGTEKMSTREGRVIFLDDILNEAKSLALKECAEKNPDLKDKEKVAEQVGIGAIIFGELSNHRFRDIQFNWKHVLAFDGETGPYVQYALVRCHSLLEKARAQGNHSHHLDEVSDYPFTAEEEAMVLTLSQFRSVLHQVIRENEPFYLTRYLIEVAKMFNRFYYQLPVLQAKDATSRKVRLNLVEGTRQTLSNGLELLGIPCPDEM